MTGSDCQYDAGRKAAQSAAGVTKVEIVGRAGYLHIEGRPGASEIRADGQACAPIEEELAGIVLKATRSGSTVRIEAIVPEHDSSFWQSSPKLDFDVTLPAGIAVDVVDSSGELTISNVGDLKVDDSSGGIEIRHTTGNVRVRDSSGEIVIEDVRGDVYIPQDSSGSIEITGVTGGVTIDEDSSGSIDIRNVQRNVAIGSDGSGTIDVTDVGGDFTVGSKGSGSIDYDNVRGKVSVPSRHRHRDN